MTADHPEGLETDDDLQRHLAELEAQSAQTETAGIGSQEATYTAAHGSLTALAEEVANLSDKLADIRSRLKKIDEQARVAFQRSAEWADASAHAQLGDYPWLKLCAAMTATFCLGRLLRAPWAPVLTAAVPFVAGKIARQTRN